MRTTSKRQANGVLRLRANGRVAPRELEKLRVKLLSTIDSSRETVLDCRGLEPWDVALVQLLVSARKSAAECGACIEIVCDGQAEKVIRLIGLGPAAGV